MKRPIFLSFIFLLSMGCVSQSQHNNILNKCDSLYSILESERAVICSLNDRITALTDSIIMYSYPADQRYSYIIELVRSEKFDEAYIEIDSLVKVFPKSPEAKLVVDQIAKIEKRKAEIKAEEDRRKALGFKIFKDKSVISSDHSDGKIIRYTFTNFYYDREYYFDRTNDVGTYCIKTADKGHTYLQADLSIYTNLNHAFTPIVYACKIVDGKLYNISNFECHYESYETYGAYLGNYPEISHDFSKVNTVNYSLGAHISNEDTHHPIIVVTGKNGTTLNDVNGLTVDDVFNKCEVIRILNRNKLK